MADSKGTQELLKMALGGQIWNVQARNCVKIFQIIIRPRTDINICVNK